MLFTFLPFRINLESILTSQLLVVSSICNKFDSVIMHLVNDAHLIISYQLDVTIYMYMNSKMLIK